VVIATANLRLRGRSLDAECFIRSRHARRFFGLGSLRASLDIVTTAHYSTRDNIGKSIETKFESMVPLLLHFLQLIVVENRFHTGGRAILNLGAKTEQFRGCLARRCFLGLGQCGETSTDSIRAALFAGE
jgi:hypothetical protein